MIMSTVAEQLRRAREEQDLSVYQVADVTKIRTDHIRALEEGKYDIFSATVYVRGFVRSYASMLKLDVNQVLADLDTELSQDKKFSEPPSLTGDHEGPLDFLMFQLSKINWRIALPVVVLILVAVLAVSGFTAWQNH
jgi:cytoskeletal protein RodZ